MSHAPFHLFAAQAQEQNSFAEAPELPLRLNGNWVGQSSSPHPGEYKNASLTDSGSSVTEIHHPPYVSLPSVGQEGIEYADLYESKDANHTQTSEIIDIDNDQKLPESKRSGLNSSADKCASTIILHDSSTGIEKANNKNDYSSYSQQLQSLPTPNLKNVHGADLHQANICDGYGIHHIGQFVPMNPNAGDVQAPSYPVVDSATGGILSSKGSLTRHHGQKISGRDQEIPSDAYGRYGHGISLPQDNFDKAYYKKHPELLEKELGSYGGIKPNWVMSSEDLNKIVHDTTSFGTRVGDSPENFGTPSEQVGFQASEKYARRISSSQPQTGMHDTHKDESIPQVVALCSGEPPAKDANLVSNASSTCEVSRDSEVSETLDHTVIIHIDDPISFDANTSVIGSPCNISRQNTQIENHHDDHGYKAPILASDEVAKTPVGGMLKPAVIPLTEIEDNSQATVFCTSMSPVPRIQIENKHVDVNIDPGSDNSSPTISNSLDNYGPLFPDEGVNTSQNQKSPKSREELKYPEMSRKFPSQDVWEDTPNSLQYTATVSVSQLPEEKKNLAKIGSERETLPQAFARRQEELAENEQNNPNKQPRNEKVKRTPLVNQPPELVITPKTMKHRFPSQDTWEDAPESLLLQTTVARPQIDEDVSSFAEDQRLLASAGTLGARKVPESLTTSDKPGKNSGFQSSATTSLTPTQFKKLESPGIQTATPTVMQERSPKVPLRSFSNELDPVHTSKQKPQIPARPAKFISRDSSGNLNSTNLPSNTVSTVKPKPPIPSRTTGSKIAALQGGFMSDLNKRLQLGPHVPKKSISKNEQCQEISENAPLVDSRKGRARGPVRRAPKQIVMPTSLMNESEGKHSLKISAASTVWSFDPEDEYLQVSLGISA